MVAAFSWMPQVERLASTGCNMTELSQRWFAWLLHMKGARMLVMCMLGIVTACTAQADKPFLGPMSHQDCRRPQ